MIRNRYLRNFFEVSKVLFSSQEQLFFLSAPECPAKSFRHPCVKTAYPCPLFPPFHCVKQRVLHAALGFQPLHHFIIQSTLCEYVVYKYWPIVPGLHLPGRAYTFDNLLVFFEIPINGKEHQNVAAVLQIQTVSRACRMHQKNMDTPSIPICDNCCITIQNTSPRKCSAYPSKIMLKMVRNKNRSTRRLFDNIVQSL